MPTWVRKSLSPADKVNSFRFSMAMAMANLGLASPCEGHPPDITSSA